MVEGGGGDGGLLNVRALRFFTVAGEGGCVMACGIGARIKIWHGRSLVQLIASRLYA